MSDEIAAIRARWIPEGTPVTWEYTEERDGEYISGAMLYIAEGADATIWLDEPNADERATLQLAAQAPGDIAALIAALDELTMLRELYDDVQRWRESGGDSRDLLYIVETAEKIERHRGVP